MAKTYQRIVPDVRLLGRQLDAFVLFLVRQLHPRRRPRVLQKGQALLALTLVPSLTDPCPRLHEKTPCNNLKPRGEENRLLQSPLHQETEVDLHLEVAEVLPS